MRSDINKYCSSIGTDHLLVQGAGGNVSWKEGNTLWIKASGTWLADAGKKDIFVPVDLLHLRGAISLGDFSVTPKLTSESELRPSIETLLHSLMPQQVVVHLHAVEILAHLVRIDFELELKKYLSDCNFKWTSCGYFKPGAGLANAVYIALKSVPAAQAVFLQNHGVVIGGENIAEVDLILKQLVHALAVPLLVAQEKLSPKSTIKLSNGKEYQPVSYPAIHRIAADADIYDRLAADWNLYPDHVVFLGAHPSCYLNIDSLMDALAGIDALPELVFIRGEGVFVQSSFSLAKLEQLLCYYEVIARQKPHSQLCTLSNAQIAELLNWDAEQYRMSLAKQAQAKNVLTHPKVRGA
jgi:rhamnose utilization protein RhaD (predicted bifunctional aldolase and dehydrogenase)